MKKNFLSIIVSSNVAWMVGLALLIMAAMVNLFAPAGDQRMLWSEAYGFLQDWTFLKMSISDFLGNVLLLKILRLVFLAGCGLLLQYISSEFRLIRTRSFFPLFLFTIFSATLMPVIPLQGAALSSFLFCWACLRLFGSLEHNEPYRGAFDASILLSLASLTECRLLYLLPVMWMVLAILQVLDVRSFFASLLGMLCVFWIIAGASFLYGSYDFLIAFGNGLIAFQWNDFSLMSPAELSYTFFLGVLMVSAMVSFWPRQYLDKLRTRNYINSVLLLFFALLGLWLFSGNDISYLLTLLTLASLMVAHFFSLVDTIYARILFVVFAVLSASVYFML